MKNDVEVLLSIMNLKDEKEFKDKIKENHIKGKVLAVNQTDGKLFNIKEGNERIYSYKEKGASRSRNILLEKCNGDICIFADNDMIYNDNYIEIIKKEYEKHIDADIIVFNITNKNEDREKIKKFKGNKMSLINIMRARTPEITITKEAIVKYNIKFDENFGPNQFFSKGEETIFLADCVKNNMKIYISNKYIGYVYDRKSSWFTGFNKKYLYDQGAIFYRIAPKIYKILIFQYIIRKYSLYRKNVSIQSAYRNMMAGAKRCKEIYKEEKMNKNE